MLKKYRLLIENLPDAFIYVVDMKTYEILFTNRYGEDVFGSAVGRRCWQVIQEGQTGPCEFCTNDKLLAPSGQPAGVYHREFRNTKNGRWYDCRDMALQWIDGRMVKLGMATDITELKQMQEKLKNEKSRLAAHLEGMLDTAAIWINTSDEKGNATYWNKAAEQISGYRAEEVIGHARVWDWIYPVPEYRKQILKMRHDIIFNGKKVENYETQIRSKDGQYRTLLWHAHNLVENGKTIGSIALAAEITERKQAEKELRISEERYRSLVDNANEAIIVIQNNLLVFANPMAVQIFGCCSVEEITSASPFDFLHLDDWEHVVKRHKKLMRKEHVENPYTIRLIVADDSLKTLSNTSVLIEWEGRPAILCLMTDITEMTKMQEEIMKADKLESIGLLAGGIAHDFNNYLATLLGNISLAKLNKNNFNKIHEKLENMEKAIHHAKNLSDQLFTFAKGGGPVKKMVSIKELILDDVKFILSGTNVRCKFLIAENLQMVEVDEGQFSQVLNNIVINAVQAMPDGGIIEVAAKNVTIESESQDYRLPLEEGPYIKISIKDRGPGIQEKDLLKIFDPFFTTKDKGKGLGLTTSYSIIKKHGGHLSVESELGVGTTFYIFLPASVQASMVTTIEEDVIYGTGKILLMDDEEDVLKVTGEMLSAFGYDVSLSRDGKEAIAMYLTALKNDRPFDLVIMDLTVPGGLGGKDTIKELLKKDPAVKAIVCSGYSNDPVMNNYSDYGFRGAIKKPFPSKELSRLVYININGYKKEDACKAR